MVPTTLDAAGIKIPDLIQGPSIINTLKSSNKTSKKNLFVTARLTSFVELLILMK